MIGNNKFNFKMSPKSFFSQKSNEEKYRRMIETANEGIWMVDKEHRTTFVNQRLLDILGYKENEMMGHKSEDFIIPEEKADHIRELKKRSQGKVSFYERRFRHKNGGVVWCYITGTPLLNDKKEVEGSFGMLTDITSSKKVERDLQMSEKKFSAAFQACPDLMSITRLSDGVILDVNDGYTKLLGYTRAESVGKTTFGLSIWSDQADRKKFIDI